MPLEIGDGCDVLQSFNENLEKKTCLNNQLKDLEKKHPRIFRDSSKKKTKASNTEFKRLLLHSSEVFFHTKKREKSPSKKRAP